VVSIYSNLKIRKIEKQIKIRNRKTNKNKKIEKQIKKKKVIHTFFLCT